MRLCGSLLPAVLLASNALATRPVVYPGGAYHFPQVWHKHADGWKEDAPLQRPNATIEERSHSNLPIDQSRELQVIGFGSSEGLEGRSGNPDRKGRGLSSPDTGPQHAQSNEAGGSSQSNSGRPSSPDYVRASPDIRIDEGELNYEPANGEFYRNGEAHYGPISDKVKRGGSVPAQFEPNQLKTVLDKIDVVIAKFNEWVSSNRAADPDEVERKTQELKLKLYAIINQTAYAKNKTGS